MTLLQTWINYVAKAENPAEGNHQIEHEAQAGASGTPHDPAPSPPVVMYFASTSLDLRQTGRPDEYPQDIFIEDVCYRKVDPEYFAWLRRRMDAARRHFECGKLSKEAWDQLRGRFNRMQEWAIRIYGMHALQAAIRDFRPATFKPPLNRQPEPYLFPVSGEWKFSEPVTPAAIRKVDAIQEAAKAMGWSDEQLYQNRGRFRFPMGQDYGLVCFVGQNCELGAVTPARIEIIHTSRGLPHSLWFNNPNHFPPRTTITKGQR